MSTQLLKIWIDANKTDWTEADEVLLSALLESAASKILNRAYPYDSTVTEVPKRYEMLQIQIAVELYSKLGAEGQTSHSENGISRAWETADVAKSLLDEIVPYVGVL